MTGPATYLYCVVESKRAPARPAGVKGPAGLGPPRAIDAGDGLWLVVASAPARRWSADAVERSLRDLRWVSRCAYAHEAVIEGYRRRATVLPSKMLTLFSSDEKAVAHVRTRRTRLGRVLRRIEGREEWGIRVELDEERADEETAVRAADRAAGLSAGAAFLARKKTARDARGRRIGEARSAADDAYRQLSSKADEARRRVPTQHEPRTSVLLEAAFLVSRRQARAFRSAVQQVARALDAHACGLVLTGPWAPYHFVTESR